MAISDTHNKHDQITVPDGDVLIHAGDATLNGWTREAQAFMEWFSVQPHATKIFVPGNHDSPFANSKELAAFRKAFPNVRILIDQKMELDGIKIYGAPWLPGILSGPKNFWLGVRGPLLTQKWDAIPDDTALLITHGPPYNVLDKNEGGQYIGDPLLAHRLRELTDLRAHVFGHVHSSYGKVEVKGRLSINAAICDPHYVPSRAPVTFDL